MASLQNLDSVGLSTDGFFGPPPWDSLEFYDRISSPAPIARRYFQTNAIDVSYASDTALNTAIGTYKQRRFDIFVVEDRTANATVNNLRQTGALNRFCRK